MVLPDYRGLREPSPERQSFYQAGNGNILDHFAGMTTPDVRGKLQSSGRDFTGRNAADRNGGDAANKTSDFALDRRSGNPRTNSNGNANGGGGVESAYSGISSRNNVENEPSREEQLAQWQRTKETGGSNTGGAAELPNSVVGVSALSRPRSAPRRSAGLRPSTAREGTQQGETLALDNQREGSSRNTVSAGVDGPSGSVRTAPPSCSMIFSPPHHLSTSSRRSTTESADSSAALPPPFGQSSMGAGKSSAYSPVAASVEFLMSRDLEEEDRAVESKSEREKAYLYKKRYTDTYVHAVTILKQMATLERARSDNQADMEVLRSQVQTQSRIIDTMSDNQNLSESTDFRQEKRMKALCREVHALVAQLGERDSLIRSLHEEREQSVRVIHGLKLSQHACESGNCGSHGLCSSSGSLSEAMRSTDEFRDMERRLQSAIRERHEALEREAGMDAKLMEVQQLYEICEAQRSALSDGLDQAEEQTAALHAQWVEEKKNLLQSVVKDDQKSVGLAAECERLRKANDSLKASFRESSEKEKKYFSILETQRRAAGESQAYITQLESELNGLRPQLDRLQAKEEKISSLESELSGTKDKLRRYLSKIDELEERLEQQEEATQATEARFHERVALLERRVFDAEFVRRSLHNKVMELKGNIRVFCRVRPVLRHEFASSGNEEIFTFPDYHRERRRIELTACPKSHVSYGQNGAKSVVKKHPFDFDLVFDSGCTQDDVFLEVSALIQSALDGYSVCIFAYGQTGSGKTYTMQGREDESGFQTMEPSSHMGIVGRAIAHIFAGMDDLRSSGWDFTASLEMVEIYNETLRDLLAPVGSADKVDLRLDVDGKPTMTNSCVLTVENELEAWNLLQKALSRRSTKSTNMNDHSSRSHCIITFRLNGVNSLTGDRCTGVVNLVDLAGSERLSKSGSDNNKELLKEALAINKSLSSLGNVISALSKKSTHIPFRDSKLTHVLSPYLGGDSKTLMICNLSPLSQHRDETLNSLRFAKMVNVCDNTPTSTSSSRS